MFRYRAVKKNLSDSLKWYLFQLKDCPALLWDDTFFLAGKPKTPIMVLDTIVRGHPTLNYFEGDRILDKNTNEELGIVVYNNGFYLQNPQSSIRKNIPERHIYVCKGDKKSLEDLNKFERTPISFKYLNTIFDFGDLVAIDRDVLSVIILNKPQKINVNGVSELLYYDKDKNYKIYEGDIVNGIFVTLDTVNNIPLD